MPWCPKCKYEYREGIKICADCGCELVDVEDLKDLESKTAALDDVMEAVDETDAFPEWEDEDEAEAEGAAFSMEQYVDSSERAEENRSSGWMLSFIGGIGLIVVILGICGIIPLRLGNPYLFYGVLCLLFFVFLIMGILSIRNAKVFAGKAESENGLKTAIREWYQNNLTGSEIDQAIGDLDGLTEEVRYFKRVQKIKDKLNHQFMNLDQPFLEHFIDDEIYDALYQEKM